MLLWPSHKHPRPTLQCYVADNSAGMCATIADNGPLLVSATMLMCRYSCASCAGRKNCRAYHRGTFREHLGISWSAPRLRMSRGTVCTQNAAMSVSLTLSNYQYRMQRIYCCSIKIAKSCSATSRCWSSVCCVVVSPLYPCLCLIAGQAPRRAGSNCDIRMSSIVHSSYA